MVTRFIDTLQIVTTSNCGAISNLLNLQITRTHVKPSQFPFISRFLVTYFNNGDSLASMLTSFPAD